MLGVAAREGDAAWDSSTGLGAVAAHKGDYHDAIHVKRNTVELRLHNVFGGFNRGATRALHALSKRATDRTAYESWAAPEFQPYWGQRISASIVMTDAKRCLHALSAMRAKARGAAAAPRPAPRPRPAAKCAGCERSLRPSLGPLSPACVATVSPTAVPFFGVPVSVRCVLLSSPLSRVAR